MLLSGWKCSLMGKEIPNCTSQCNASHPAHEIAGSNCKEMQLITKYTRSSPAPIPRPNTVRPRAKFALDSDGTGEGKILAKTFLDEDRRDPNAIIVIHFIPKRTQKYRSPHPNVPPHWLKWKLSSVGFPVVFSWSGTSKQCSNNRKLWKTSC